MLQNVLLMQDCEALNKVEKGIRTNDWSPAASDCQVLPAKVKDTITTIGELSILDSTTLPQTRDIMLTSQISAGQLSSEAEVLNLQLYQAFETASHGKALLLLNEADVFL
ncbi:conserved hypothetical protein [Histoplasma capsulatum var. duboisii H88]|uniref:Uncharacterized protein n=2 Tax=Ajellomyces capsulatus (strain H88) TaxID=544711 RepID=F0UHA7_AJEC8|nr:conserved hypothetical protein [Histoplasma capsulatum var. duboisii H88]